MSLAVDDPEIFEVMDLRTGECRRTEDIVGDDQAAVSQFRQAIWTGIHKKEPLFACTMCGIPVRLLGRRRNRADNPNALRYYFRHTIEDGRCSAVTRGSLSLEEIDARKYNGAKESWQHRQIKNWVAECLHRDARFSGVEVEKRWTGALTGEWRKPDVRAWLGEIPVAFEIQLSTTHLHVVSGRRLFYLEQGGLLFWVFARFDDDGRRLTQEDIFYNNNQNAFIVDSASVEASLERGAFQLQCAWSVPTADGQQGSLQRKLVSFHDLTLDLEQQQAYYYDYYGALAALKQAADEARVALERAAVERCAVARARFEQFWLDCMPYGDVNFREWHALRRTCEECGCELPTWPRELPRRLLTALYSAKYGRPVGTGLQKLVQVAHWFSRDRADFALFHRALKVYGREAQLLTEGRPERWLQRLADLRDERRDYPERFEPDTTHWPLVKFLFPELRRPGKEAQPARAEADGSR